MKLKKSIGLMLSSLLLFSSSSYACAIRFDVFNQWGSKLEGVSLQGPCLRHSGSKDLNDGQSFQYSATGELCSCHGEWRLFVHSLRKSERISDQYIKNDAQIRIYIKQGIPGGVRWDVRYS